MPEQQFAKSGQEKEPAPADLQTTEEPNISESAKAQSDELRSARFQNIKALESAFSGQSVVGYGSKGKGVVAVQASLNELGNDAGKADGFWGGKTTKAMMGFQASKGLGVDGKLGSNSMRALDKADVSIGGTAVDTPTKTPKPPEEEKAKLPPELKKEEEKKEEKEVSGGETPVTQTDDVGTETQTGDTGEKSEADLLRESIASNAEAWKGEEFMSQAEIDKVRKNANMPNYTTCIDFAGKMMRESVGGMYGSDPKKAQQTAMMLSQIKGDWEKGVGAGIQAAQFQKAVDKCNKAITELEEKKAAALAKVDHLRRPAEEGEPEYVVKARHKQADIQEKQLTGVYDSHIAKLEKQRDGWQAKVDKKAGEAAELDANNPAMIKTQPGMSNGRPQVGEYIIWAQAPGGGSYGVSDDSQVSMAGGMFKHIAVFMSAKEVKPGIEEWTTIDGGGTHGKETVIYVRTKDARIFRTPDIVEAEPGKPWTGTPSNNVIAGWIDTEKMLAMRDAK